MNFRFSLLVTMPLLVLLLSGCEGSKEVARQRFVEKGNKLYDAGNYRDASVEYRNAIKRDQNFGEAYYRLGLAELRRDNYRRAAAAFGQAVRLMPNHKESIKELADLYLSAFLMGSRAEGADRLRNDAQQLADRLIAMDANSYDGVRIRGYLEAQRGDSVKAIATLERADKIRPDQPEIILPLVQTLTLANRFPEAERMANEFLKRRKEYPPLYDYLYLHYLAVNRPEDADRVIKLKAENNPNQALALVQLAGHFHKRGKVAEADEVVKPILDRPQDYPGGLLAICDYYAVTGRYDEAKRMLQKGEQVWPKEKVEHRKRLAVVLYAEGKTTEAVNVLDGLLREDPENEAIQTARGSLLRETTDPNLIEASVTQFRTLMEKSPNNAALRFNLGQSLLAKGDLEGARQEFFAASRTAPRYLVPLQALAELSVRTQRYDELKQVTTKILEIEPANPRARLLRAVSLAGTGDLQTARFELGAMLKERPDSAQVQLELAVLNAQQGRFSDAEQGFRKFYRPGSMDLRLLASLATLMLSQGKVAEANKLIDSEIKLNPVLPGLHWMKATVQLQEGNQPAAVNSLMVEAKNSPNDARVPSLLGQLAAQQGRLPEALGHYRKALQMAPEDPAALNNVAYYQFETGEDLTGALLLAEKAQKLAPRDLGIADTIGCLQLRMGKRDEALSIFTKLVGAEPRNAAFRYHLGWALFEKGDRSAAKRELTAALGAKPGPRDEAKIKALLEKLS